jgi:hypothetical protein
MSDKFEVLALTNDAVTAVAKAMDVDDRLDWKSTDHEKVVECANAMAEARHFIIGFWAVDALMRGQLPLPPPSSPPPEPPEAPAQPAGDTGVEEAPQAATEDAATQAN